MAKLQKLDADHILATAQRLERRVGERFYDSGLSRVSGQLTELASRAKATTLWIREPNFKLRVLSVSVIGAIVVASVLVLAASIGSDSGRKLDWADVVQISEAAMNGLVLLGAAIWFFVSIETRFKRGRVLRALHELRTLAHLVDVHQLTKDPDALMSNAPRTESSPERMLAPWQVSRYLDYCSEMLSLTGTIAALYSEGFDDPQAVDAVTDLEALTNALQQKIWQKIVLLETRIG
jgi:hypothetical protein